MREEPDTQDESEPVNERPAAPWRTTALAVVVALLLFFYFDHFRLALEKKYSVDEFQYAHGGWLLAQGQVIYRDFFEHHLPLIHQLIGLVFVFLDDDPNNILYLRLLMVPFWSLTLLASFKLNRDFSKAASWVAPLIVLMVPTYAMMATEIRPDTVALSLFVASLAALTIRSLRPQGRGFVAGLLFLLALWGTLKVAYYGLIVPAAWVADVYACRRGAPRRFLASPLFFVFGCLAAGLPIVVWLTATHSWSAWFEWTLLWSFIHQRTYPGFDWLRNFWQLFALSFWLFPVAAVGVVATLRRRPQFESADLLLLGGLITTLASFAWQSAAYLYSLMPFTVFLCLFAARGLVVMGRAFRSQGAVGVFCIALATLVLLVEVQRAHGGLSRLLATTNESQHALWRELNALTRPEEPVFHIAGGQITRPSVHYFYFMEAVVRELRWQVFAEELPQSLADKGCIAYLPSDRFDRLPETLQRFLLAHYLPRSPGLWFWGMRIARQQQVVVGESREPGAPREPLRGDFLAPRDGLYFVWPLDRALGGALAIDDVALSTPVFALDKGLHRVELEGAADELFLAWLPADGVPFAPRLELRDRMADGAL